MPGWRGARRIADPSSQLHSQLPHGCRLVHQGSVRVAICPRRHESRALSTPRACAALCGHADGMVEIMSAEPPSSATGSEGDGRISAAPTMPSAVHCGLAAHRETRPLDARGCPRDACTRAAAAAPRDLDMLTKPHGSICTVTRVPRSTSSPALTSGPPGCPGRPLRRACLHPRNPICLSWIAGPPRPGSPPPRPRKPRRANSELPRRLELAHRAARVKRCAPGRRGH